MGHARSENRSVRILRFGAFELDMETETLFERGRRVHLQEMPLRILLILLERPGEPVSHEEFYRRLWPNDEFGVLEDNLYTAMGKLRRALRDPARKPQFIETIPKRGYRFVAPVLPVYHNEDSNPGTSQVWRAGQRGLVVVLATLVLVAGWYLLKPDGEGKIQAGEQRILAVLPFENLGRSEDQYFADGVSDEITARLLRMDDLAVIGRTSAAHFRGADLGATAIGRELGADYVLHGSVRWEHLEDDSSRVRVTPQLVRTRDGRHLWATVYEQPLAGVFRVQADIAEQVAKAMDVTLMDPERAALQAEPTAILDAYDLYLRANEYLWRSEKASDIKLAINMYEQAVELDPEFALAWARLSGAHARMYWFHWDHSATRLEQAGRAIERAMALDPATPEVRLALGTYHYWGHLDYDRALSEFEAVRASLSGSAEFQLLIGSVYRRQGRWSEAARHYQEAARLDPRSAFMNIHAGQVLYHKRYFDQAMEYLDRARSFAPDIAEPYFVTALIHLARDGDTRQAREAVYQGLKMTNGAEMLAYWLQWTLLVLDLYEGQYEQAMERVGDMEWEFVEHQYQFQPLALLRAYACEGLGERECALEGFAAAEGLIREYLEDRPDDPRLLSVLGIALAGQGQREAAIAAGRKALDLMPPDLEAMRGPYRVEELARIHVMLGEFEEAIPKLELLLQRPSHFSVAHLKNDPAWAPLYPHPDYRRLVTIHSH